MMKSISRIGENMPIQYLTEIDLESLMQVTGSISPAALDQYSKQVGDSVTTKTMDKAMDIQASNAAALIQSVQQSMPTADANGRLGTRIDAMA